MKQVAGDPAVAPQLGKFMGVRNGIDIDIWDPETDTFLPRTYGPDTVVEGKVTRSLSLYSSHHVAEEPRANADAR